MRKSIFFWIIAIFMLLVSVNSALAGDSVAEFTGGNSFNAHFIGSQFGARYAQGFTVNQASSIDTASFRFGNAGGDIKYVIVRIETDSGGLPSGTLVDPAAEKNITYVASSQAYAVFSSNISLSAGTMYHLVIIPSYWTTGIYAYLNMSVTDDYENGSASCYNAATGNFDGCNLTTWTNRTFDLWFMVNGSVTPGVSNFTVSATNLFGSTAINNFSVEVGGVNYSTTTGTVSTSLLSNESLLYDVFLFGAQNNQGGFFNRTYSNVNVSSNLAAELWQTEVILEASELFTDTNLSGTFKRNGSIVSGILFLDAGDYNFSFTNASYYQKDNISTILPLFNGTINIGDVYNSLLSIRGFNAYTNNSISNFSGWIYNNETTNNITFVSNGNVSEVPLILGNYSVYFEGDGYSISSANFQNLELVNTSYSLNFSLYSSNSIYVFIYDETTGSKIFDNISITITGNASEFTNYTTSGEFFYENLTDGEYTLKFSGDNYSLRTYSVTVSDNSTQTLEAFLSANTQTVTFSILDYDSAASLTGVNIIMQRQINSTWTTIEAKTSDISGRAQFTYLPSVKYRFVLTFSGYETNTFYLDPVIFTTYNVRMQKLISFTSNTPLSDVGVTWQPKLYLNDALNNFSLTILSGSGSLEYYNLSIVFPGGNYSATGNSSLGEVFNFTLNITGASWNDEVNLSYCYKSSIEVADTCLSYIYLIDGTYSSGSFMDNANNTHGLGLFERILIATLVTLAVAGIVGLFAGAISGAVLGLLSLSYFAITGFVPVWAVTISLVVGFIVIAWRSSQ